MSSKKTNSKKPEEEFERKPSLMERPRFNLIYTIVVFLFIGAGVILVILSYTALRGNEYMLFVALGVLGVGIILLTMRSTYKQSAPSTSEEEEEEEKDEGLKMRNR